MQQFLSMTRPLVTVEIGRTIGMLPKRVLVRLKHLNDVLVDLLRLWDRT